MWLALDLILLDVAWVLFRVAEALGKNKEKECDHQYGNEREQRKLAKKSRNKREKNKKSGKNRKMEGGDKNQRKEEIRSKDKKQREREKESKIPSWNSTTDNTGKEKEKVVSTIATSDLYYLLTLVIEQQKRGKNNEKMTDTTPATIQPSAPTQNVILDFSQFLAAQIPLPGQPGVPYLDGKEVTKFVRSQERFSERYKIADKKMVNELVDYCEVNTGEYVATIIDKAKREIQGANLRESWWPKVRTGLLKNFKSDDSEQQKNMVTFLKSFSSNKPFRMKAEEVERYIRTYQQISNTQVSEMRSTAVVQMICFLQGLPDNTAMKIFKDMTFKVDENATFSANRGFSGAVTIAQTMTRKKANVSKMQELRILREERNQTPHTTEIRILRNPNAAKETVNQNSKNAPQPQTQEKKWSDQM